MKKFSSLFALGALVVCIAAGAASGPVVTTQILDYERGYVFFTTGDGFKVAPDVVIVNGPAVPPRYARVTFDANGVVTRIEVSTKKLPAQGDLAAIHRYAVALSPPQPNPELAGTGNRSLCARTVAGKHVLVAITVQVPPTTGVTDNVYMTSDQSAWNAQAYKLDRVDALHYRTVLTLASGTQMHVLFDRGSTQSIQVGENGIEQQPYLLCVGDSDVQAFTKTVARWGDESAGGTLPVPQTMPTPYNPAPFPNLPTPPPGPLRTPLAN
ncbi:MAG TPA: hypothetical protein VJP85_12005 [Candidatus Baltobacteraceae bacterium]|nr:hypothetical protein [Candidatus Baltobacteraceae bacterium]